MNAAVPRQTEYLLVGEAGWGTIDLERTVIVTCSSNTVVLPDGESGN